jgi:uncharacterized damage-inducible protein DinB
MLLEILIKIFKRDLNKLKTEVLLYKNEDNLWLVHKDVTNSAGNLCLHIVGNLNTYIGAELGNTGYIRKRDLEFSLKHISRKKLIQQVDDTIVLIENTLNKLSLEDLNKEYSLLVFKEKTTTEYFLVHLVDHLSYHLGQINYHRRLLD